MKTFQQFLEQKNICSKCKMRPAGDNEGFEDVPANTWCNKCLGQHVADTMMARPMPTQKQIELDTERLIKDIEEEIRKSQGDKVASAAIARFHADPTPAWIKILGWYMGGQDNIKNIR